MSEARREKRAAERKPVKKVEKKVYKIRENSISLDEKKVEVVIAGKKIVYTKKNNPVEYINFGMVFDVKDTKEEQTDFANVLFGIELIPSYAHANAELASKIYQVVLEDFAERVDGQTARGESDEELSADDAAMLEMKLQEIIK